MLTFIDISDFKWLNIQLFGIGFWTNAIPLGRSYLLQGGKDWSRQIWKNWRTLCKEIIKKNKFMLQRQHRRYRADVFYFCRLSQVALEDKTPKHLLTSQSQTHINSHVCVTLYRWKNFWGARKKGQIKNILLWTHNDSSVNEERVSVNEEKIISKCCDRAVRWKVSWLIL